jgi:hypothetical protein
MISQDSIQEKPLYLWSMFDYLIKHMKWTELEVFYVFIYSLFILEEQLGKYM